MSQQPELPHTQDVIADWKGSQFNYRTPAEDGSLLLYNTYVGALARIATTDTPIVVTALEHGVVGEPTGVLAELALNGFLIPRAVDEMKLAEDLHAQSRRTDALELILMPNENCNFRCVYCYESFARNKMLRPVIEGVVEHVRQRAHDLVGLRIGWFGGEPLTAPRIIEELSSRLQAICHTYDIEYSSSMVTNGYLFTPAIAAMLFRAEVRQFQITLDGPKEHHNRLRVLADGRQDTFDRIFSNLLMLRDTDEPFQVVVRVNFDAQSHRAIDGLLQELRSELLGDPRFHIDFHPVGQWGGPGDAALDVCGVEEGRSFRDSLFAKASGAGLNMKALRQRLEPFGSSCYAANPRSFVIGSDGMVYKCTVAFEDPRNHVGRMMPDGQLVLDDAKVRMWTESGEETDGVCQQCFFRPACQGNACPLDRIANGNRPCPSTKLSIDGALKVLAADAVARVEMGPTRHKTFSSTRV